MKIFLSFEVSLCSIESILEGEKMPQKVDGFF